VVNGYIRPIPVGEFVHGLTINGAVRLNAGMLKSLSRRGFKDEKVVLNPVNSDYSVICVRMRYIRSKWSTRFNAEN